MSTANCQSCHGRRYHTIDGLDYRCLYCRGTGEDQHRHCLPNENGYVTGDVQEQTPIVAPELPPAFREPEIADKPERESREMPDGNF